MLPNPLIRPDPTLFEADLALLERYYARYAATCPVALVEAGLLLTEEIRYQCELYLPMELLCRLFDRLYRASLRHSPIYGATPLHGATGWADCFQGLPPSLQLSPNPARLLRRLLDDPLLHEQFIYYSFLPGRYNGAGFGRYPEQLNWLQQWFRQSAQRSGLHCLDAACGSGEGCWELVELAAMCGLQPEQIRFSGWTLDPLEVYAAEQRYLPHLPQRQQQYRQRVEPLLPGGWGERVSFQAVDLLGSDLPGAGFDLIVCNGLLGGPILHQPGQISQLIERLAALLEPGGILLAANCFHGGWQQRISESMLREICGKAGLEPLGIAVGIAVRRGGR